MTTNERTIDYEALAQDAMRGVVRTVLVRAAKTGLPGDHHFYISFDTQAPGVSLSKRLKEKYPEEMTIVLQHRFWDLLVGEERFEVKLTFDGIPERLVVPFAAIKVFFDPSVRYGLQFEGPDFGPETFPHAVGGPEEGLPTVVTGTGENGSGPLRQSGRGSGERKPRAPRKPRTDKSADTAGAATRKPSQRDSESPSEEPAAPSPNKPVPLAPVPSSGGAEIVSLDSFRKK